MASLSLSLHVSADLLSPPQQHKQGRLRRASASGQEEALWRFPRASSSLHYHPLRGEYGIWAAFLALLVRLFFYIPGELELPLVACLLVIVAPHQVMRLRGRQEGAILSLVIAGYLAFQHFSRIGSLNQSFDRGTLSSMGVPQDEQPAIVAKIFEALKVAVPFRPICVVIKDIVTVQERSGGNESSNKVRFDSLEVKEEEQDEEGGGVCYLSGGPF
ncbi:hypothetical protein J5N97_001920 [Dioscorea zingiberensis]|uniref:Uncharacterized protein n=1 Tax=Dioscorea zingiberensis TaxID=325984 RepID=A0A9D5BTH8_9LILI|nr:hypothetical protein J5N97_001920 [Dioscorea zingiberensis]